MTYDLGSSRAKSYLAIGDLNYSLLNILSKELLISVVFLAGAGAGAPTHLHRLVPVRSSAEFGFITNYLVYALDPVWGAFFANYLLGKTKREKLRARDHDVLGA